MKLRDETGAGTVVVLMCVGVLLVLTVAGLHLGSAAGTAHRARSGADLTALAAAGAVQQGHADPCAVSAEIARRNGTRLVACAVGPDDTVLVRVAVRLSLAWPGLPDVVEVRARAGPGSGAPAQVRGLRVPSGSRVPSESRGSWVPLVSRERVESPGPWVPRPWSER